MCMFLPFFIGEKYEVLRNVYSQHIRLLLSLIIFNSFSALFFGALTGNVQITNTAQTLERDVSKNSFAIWNIYFPYSNSHLTYRDRSQRQHFTCTLKFKALRNCRFFGDNYVTNVAWWILSDYRNSSQRSHEGSFTAQQLFIRHHGNRFWNFQLTSKYEQLAASENVVCCHSTLWFWNIIHPNSPKKVNTTSTATLDVMQLCCDCVWEWEENKENSNISGDSRNGEHNEQHHGRHKLNQDLIKFLPDILPLFFPTEQEKTRFSFDRFSPGIGGAESRHYVY